MSMFNGRRVAMVLGGGGLKGLAHIGVLKVLGAHGIVPDEYVGTSVGSIVAALAAGGLRPEEIERVALNIRRSDILDYDWKGLIVRRSRVRSLYKGVALRSWLRRSLPVTRFSQLMKPAYFTAVDMHTCQEVIWSAETAPDLPLDECVAASCAIPGIYPPVKIGGRHFVDGTLVDTLPVSSATVGPTDLIIAVYLDEVDSGPAPSPTAMGIGGILEQAQSIMSLTLLNLRMNHFSRAPVTLIRPHVRSHKMFQFNKTQDVIRAGEEAALHALATEPALRGAIPVRDKSRPATRVWQARPEPMTKRAEDGLAIPGPEGLPEGGAATS